MQKAYLLMADLAHEDVSMADLAHDLSIAILTRA